MRLSLDKVHESVYHYRNAKEKITDVESAKEMQQLVHIVNEFRFEISALSSSIVSIRNAFLKEAAIISNDSLIQWIEKNIQQEVFNDPNFQLIYKLRNVNIHEGNIFLTFKFSTKVTLGVLKFEVDLSKDPKDAVTQSEFLSHEYDSELESSLIEEDELEKWKSTINEYNEASKEAAEKNSFFLETIKIPQLNLEYSPSDFLQKCKEAGELLQRKIFEARESFDFESHK